MIKLFFFFKTTWFYEIIIWRKFKSTPFSIKNSSGLTIKDVYKLLNFLTRRCNNKNNNINKNNNFIHLSFPVDLINSLISKRIIPIVIEISETLKTNQ